MPSPLSPRALFAGDSLQHESKSIRERTSHQKDKSQQVMLIIDDHADSLFYAQQAVEIFGYKSLTLECGQRALTVAKTNSPALIFLDLCLEDTDGFEVLRQLKEDKITAHIPVVAVTALVSPSIRSKALAAGFASFLAKPYTLTDIEAVINCCMQRAEKLNMLSFTYGAEAS